MARQLTKDDLTIGDKVIFHDLLTQEKNGSGIVTAIRDLWFDYRDEDTGKLQTALIARIKEIEKTDP